jgi:hypothetical protein
MQSVYNQVHGKITTHPKTPVSLESQKHSLPMHNVIACADSTSEQPFQISLLFRGWEDFLLSTRAGPAPPTLQIRTKGKACAGPSKDIFKATLAGGSPLPKWVFKAIWAGAGEGQGTMVWSFHTNLGCTVSLRNGIFIATSRMHACMCVRMCVCVYICAWVCACICVGCMCTCMCVCIGVPARMCARLCECMGVFVLAEGEVQWLAMIVG